MKRLKTAMPLRRAFVSKAFAALLVVLAISPFTAPFSTCDLAELSGNTAVHQGVSSAEKIVQEVSAIDLIVPIADPFSFGLALEAAGRMDDTGKRQARPIVLRL